jgi:Tol biopolymer transport system component
MGEVYRARDARLGRDVALKVLRRQVGDRRRFETEARAVSALNHPNILTVHDIGEEDGSPYIVTELLEGDNLRATLRAGPLPARQVLDIAIQVAAGLAAAHARGIVHRDLKPENIFVLRDGRVKILDFGLAKSSGVPEIDDGTQTAPGMLLGTVPYMSPEQVQDQPLDPRSDQFSFGTIVYEMMTGTHPFRASDRVGTMSAIVRGEPAPFPPSSIDLPPLHWIIDRCLAKDPGQRYDSTADLHAALKDVRDHISDAFRAAGGAEKSPRAVPRPRVAGILLLLAGLLAALFAFVSGAVLMQRAMWNRSYHYTPFATETADETQPAWSPDGSAIAYTSETAGLHQIFVRRVDRPTAAQMNAAPASCFWPFWSSDGSRIYYWSNGALWAFGAAGGEPRMIVRDVSLGAPPATISPDGRTIAYFQGDGSMFNVRLLSTGDNNSQTYAHTPFPARFRITGGLRFAPDGRKLLAWVVPQIDRGAEMWIVPFPNGEPTRMATDLLRGYHALHAAWMPDSRHIVVAIETAPGRGTHLYSLDTRTGEARHLTMGTSEEREPSVSPDGDRIAFSTGNSNADLLEISTDGRRVAPLLATSRSEHSADWSADGRQYVYVTEANGAAEVWLRSFAEGWARPVVERSADGRLDHSAPRLSPDGRKIAYMRIGANHQIWIGSLSGGLTVPLEQENKDQHAPAWSPDGKWVAYARYRDMRWEIAKAPSGGEGGAVSLSPGGGALAQIEWSPNGGELCFLDGQNLMRLPLSGGNAGLVAKGIATFMYRKDGRAVYVLRQDRDLAWEMATVDLPSGVERDRVSLGLESGTTLDGARLHPDGTHFVVSVAAWKRDIWILDGLKSRGLLELWQFWRPAAGDEGVRH